MCAKAGPEGALTWPSQVVRLSRRLKELVQFVDKITGRPLKRAQPARAAAADGLPTARWLHCDNCNKWRYAFSGSQPASCRGAAVAAAVVAAAVVAAAAVAAGLDPANHEG